MRKELHKIIFEEMKEKDDTEFLFPHEKKEHKHITYTKVCKHLAQLVTDAGLEPHVIINPHSLRHLFARLFHR